MAFDEVNTRIDQPMEHDIHRGIQGLINPWNMIFAEASETFYQRTLLGTSVNQQSHYLNSYNNKKYYTAILMQEHDVTHDRNEALFANLHI